MAFVAIHENELQTRSRIVRNHIKERDNCIILKVDTQLEVADGLNPFGFHFEFDKKKYKEVRRRKSRQKITRFFAFISHYHHKYGLRHITLLLLLAGYVFLGGLLFVNLESPREMSDLRSTLVLMQGIMSEEVAETINMTLTLNGTEREVKLTRLIKRYYKTMLEAEGRFHGSVWHKAENLDMHLMWYFSSASFYSMTLFSTIGYGTISCQTSLGKILSMLYASIGLPLMLVVLGDIGEWFQKILTKGYIFLLIKYKALRKQTLKQNLEEIYLPMWLALFIVIGYIMLCTFLIHRFDHSEGNRPGIGFDNAFYFTFISLTTIGLGDVMPYNIQYSPFLAAAFLLGLALISIVNTSIYTQLYTMFMNMIDDAEDTLERIHHERYAGPGYMVFQDMEPAIRMLVCTFPSSSGDRKKLAVSIRDSFRRKKDEGREPKRRSQTASEIGDLPSISRNLSNRQSGKYIRRRTPTLGAFGGHEIRIYERPRARSTTYSRDDDIVECDTEEESI